MGAVNVRTPVVLISLLAVLGLAAPATAAQDRHAGYYYPEVTSREVYKARAKVLDEADRKARIGFIVGMTETQGTLPYPPTYAVIAKGEEAEKMIIIGLDGESFRTLYRARAMLGRLTAQARSTTLFRRLAVEDYFTFFDLIRMLGFEQLTVSDGETYAHQVTFE